MPEIECPKCQLSKRVDDETFETCVGKPAKCRCGYTWVVERAEIDLAAFAAELEGEPEAGTIFPPTTPWGHEGKDHLTLAKESQHVIVTTTNSVDGYRIEKYFGIESIEYVIGTGIFSEISAGIADIFGTRASAFERKLQEAKRVAFETLKIRAHLAGANAVVGVDMDYSEFTGNQVALIVNGTLVKLAWRPEQGDVR